MIRKRYVIIGSDENKLYFDFWPIISRTWREKFNMIPVLGLICDEDSDFIEDAYGIVKKFKVIDGISKALQSQIVRLYLPSILDGDCLMSDIDMMPLSKEYFNGLFDNLMNNEIIVTSADHKECLLNSMYPMCYILASSDIYIKNFDLDLSWNGFCNLLNNRKQNWYTDQKYLYEKINSCKEGTIKTLFNRGWNNGIANYRIDRINWKYEAESVNKGKYIDSHLLRPYEQNKIEIDKLFNLI